MSLDKEQILQALRPVQDPELRRSIVDLGMVRGVTIDGSSIEVEIALTIEGCPMRATIERSVMDAVASLGEDLDSRILFSVMTEEERSRVTQIVHGSPSETAGSQPAHGHAEGRSIPFAQPDSKTRVLLIASGKGGVGKSSVTTNLALAFAMIGKEVGVVDADVWGFSIPRMLGIDRPPTIIDELLIPPERHGVKAISMGFFAQEDQPVIWRGPMLHKALEQFLTDVYWDNPDYLLIDLPPGTGDIALSLAQFLPHSELYVVTTPQAAAQKVAQRAAFMAENVNLRVKGVIENMSWFTGDDDKRYYLFGSGGGQDLADRLNVPLIGQIPFTVELREGSDIGDPLMASLPSSEAAKVFSKMVEIIDVELAPTRKYNKGLKFLK